MLQCPIWRKFSDANRYIALGTHPSLLDCLVGIVIDINFKQLEYNKKMVGRKW